MSKQQIVIDKLMDVIPSNIDEISEKIFLELIECNNNEFMKLSSYVLCEMWNKSDAVLIGWVSGKTANDFHSNINWKN